MSTPLTYLELCQELHREARYAGSTLTGVTGQTGNNLDIVSWVRDAWLDIQQEYDGRWKWLLREFTLPTVAAKRAYTFGDCTDTVDAAPISRFQAWHLAAKYLIPKIYLTANGKASEQYLVYIDWERFENIYEVGTPQSDGHPVHITINPMDEIELGPTPSDAYTVTAYYFMSAQTLSADSDIPECPPQFHRGIWMEAMIKHAYMYVAQEQLARMDRERSRVISALRKNQSMARFSFKQAPPMAG